MIYTITLESLVYFCSSDSKKEINHHRTHFWVLLCALLNCVDLIRRETLKKLYKLVVISTAMISAAAFAMAGYREDISSGNSISNGLHKTVAASAGRAEFRCNPSENSACSKRSGTINFSGEFKVNGGANISVA
jgi:hypothetical protein